MKKELIDLQRTFVHLPGNDWSNSSADLDEASGEAISWRHILDKRCSVIVATANSGKSSEFELQKEALRKAGEHCALVPVRALIGSDVQHGFDTAEWDAVETWRETKNRRLILFLDSIDEAAIRSADDLKLALRKLSDAVGGNKNDVRWVLSTRPAMLNNDVRAAISGALAVEFPELLIESSGKAIPSSVDEAAKATTDERKRAAPETVQRYLLRDLSSKQTEKYLRDRLKIDNASILIDAAKSHGLASMLHTPGRLNLLSKMNLVGNPPVALKEIYSRSVNLQINDYAGIRPNISQATPEALHKAVTRIACASTLCEKLNIDLPAAAESSTSSALSARAIVRELTEAGLSYLLGTSLFEDTGYYSQVKLQPDDFRAYLSATRLSELIGSKQDAINVLQVIGWRAPTGEAGVFSKWLPLAGWLATFNRHFRIEVLKIDPQAVAFFGDLRSIDADDGKAALTGAFARIAEGERPGRDVFTLTSENYWQAGPSYLEGHLGMLYEKHLTHAEAKRILLKIARIAQLNSFKPKVLAEVGGDIRGLVKSTELLAYFVKVANEDEQQQLAEFVRTADSIPQQSLNLLVSALSWTVLNSIDMAALTIRCAENHSENFDLRWRLKEALEIATTGQRAEYAMHLLAELAARVINGGDGSGRRVFRKLDWLVELVANILVFLIQDARDPSQVKDVADLIEKFIFAGESYWFIQFDVEDLREAISDNPELRLELLKRIIFRAGSDTNVLQAKLIWPSSLVNPTLEDAELVGAANVIYLLKEAEAQRKKQQLQEPEKTKKANRKEASDIKKTKARLMVEIKNIEAGLAKDALAWIAQSLCYSSGNVSKYGEVSFEAFTQNFGVELATAAANGLKKLWRNEPPSKDESNPHSTYWITAAGLQGVNLELSDANGNYALSGIEVERALDYALYEMNGLPSWFWNVVEHNLEHAEPFLNAVLKDHARSPHARERALTLVNELKRAPENLSRMFARMVWGLALEMNNIGQYELSAALSLACRSTTVSVEEFSAEAAKRIFLGERSVSAIWSAYWISLAPQEFISALETKDQDDKGAVEQLIFEVAAYLESERELELASLVKRNEHSIEALAKMYLRLSIVVPSEKDPVYPSGVVFNVDNRERARIFRDRLPVVIASINTARAYDALRAIQAYVSHEPELHWLRRLSSLVAETMHAPKKPMSEEDYLYFEQDLYRPAHDIETFAQNIENDLLEVKEEIENGDFSPRRFLGSRRKSNESKTTYERALEDDFQIYLAGQLALVGRKKYSVVREEQLAEATRRDIGIHHLTLGRATLELKASETGWTLAEYKKALHDQLVGMYIKARGATIGFLVILLQRPRNWQCDDGTSVDFAGLLKILVAEANAIEVNRPELRVRVIGIDASEPLGWEDVPKRIPQAKQPGKAKPSTAPGKSTKKLPATAGKSAKILKNNK